ncbi:diaminopimelate epimerase [Sphingosinicella sp. YJ22]|uniref:diaminopimelate epimerase n=1 Tax=Sphingosinicella sp. YJ22 TaxID=1104780 RepID=UPI00140772D9|nr:diaminopimelate epimerase [Sphingosinicella sp. YJ22]
MGTRFHKMHGLGNDFVVLDAREAPVAFDADRVRTIADRRTGIGCDQLIVLEHSDRADLRMRIFNADGGEVESCGNASRCVALLEGGESTIETKGGIIRATANDGGATVDMGKPRFGWDDIPLAYAMETAPMPVGWEDLHNPIAVNVGNPHVVFLLEDSSAIDLARLGPLIEKDPLFPEGVNVNVAETRIGGMNLEGVRRNGLDLRVWERGAGLTQACGSGACATAVAAIKYGHMTSPVAVNLPGGTLVIEWAPGESVRMSGAAVHVFTGEIEL